MFDRTKCRKMENKKQQQKSATHQLMMGTVRSEIYLFVLFIYLQK